MHSVWKAKDDFSAGTPEVERMLKDVVFPHVVGEVVRFPISAVRRTMAFHDAVAVGYAGFRKTGAHDPQPCRVLKVSLCIDVQATPNVAPAQLEVGFVCGQFEDVVVERRH